MINNKIIYITIAILILLVATYSFRTNLQNLLTYGFGDHPTRQATEKCPWKKEVFEKAGLTAFVANCTEQSAFDPVNGYAMTFSDADEKVIGKWATNPDSEFTIQVLVKQSQQEPIDVVKEWYAKLTPEQQRVCEIQDVDEAITYFPDGSPNFHQRPNPTAHKTRYAIDIKSDVAQQIMAQHDGSPGTGEGYDYMCGSVVGTTWSAYPPYFEFDDRSPDKYLLVDSYAFEAPPIDLNSIRF